MLFSIVSLLAFGAVSSAFPVLEERSGNGCNADNVLRLLRATQRLDESLPFCSQYLGLPLITKTAPAVPAATATSTVFKTVTETTSFAATTIFQKRSDLPSTTPAPSATISTPDFILRTTIDPSRLSSACNCFTIPLSTTTTTITPTSGTITVIETGTTTVVSTVSVTATVTNSDVVLASPTSAAGWGGKVAEFDSDDTYYRIELPFEVEVYGFKSSLLFVSINGLIWLDERAQGNYQFYYNDADTNGADLPLGPDDLPDIAILPFWSDLYVVGGATQGVYYETTGSAGSRTFTLEILAASYDSMDSYHFTAAFKEGKPNKVTFKYYGIADSTYGTVAIQHKSDNKALTFSRYGSNVVPGLTLEFDTTTGLINHS